MSKSTKLTPEAKNGLFIASGSTHPELAIATAQKMGMVLGDVALKQFPNSELYARYGESVRGKHVVIIQTLGQSKGHSVNDSLQELLIMIDAARRASATQITAVCPNYAYGRQDRKSKGRESISAKLVANQIVMAGADRLVSIDLHASQIQGFIDKPFDHLTAFPQLRKTLKKIMGDEDHEQFAIVTPDAGRSKVVQICAEALGLDVVQMQKVRDRSDSDKIRKVSRTGSVEGRTCFVVDDMIDTAGTLTTAMESLHEAGAGKILVAATHAIFSDPAVERLQASPIDRIIVTDTLPTADAQIELGDRLQVVSVAPMLGQSLVEISMHGSVSRMFRDENYM